MTDSTAVLAITSAITLAPSIAVLIATWAAARTPRLSRATASASLHDVAMIVRPIAGSEDGDVEAHASLFAQRARPERIVFVAENERDAGLGAVDQARATATVPSERQVATGPERVNAKVRNLMTAWRLSPSPFVAFADGDLALDPDTLGACLAEFDAPDVGAVYVPVLFDAKSLPGRLATMTALIDGFPLLFASAGRRRSPALLGGFVVVRREALERAGGLAAIAPSIADDARLHRVLTRAGYRVRAAPLSLVHRSGVEGWQAWTRRYRRWMLGQWLEQPGHFALGLLANPFSIAALSWWWLGTPAAAALLATNLGVRTLVAAAVASTLVRAHGLDIGAAWLARPLADLYHLGHSLDVVLRPIVRWRDVVYRAGIDRRVRRVNV